MGNVDWYLAMHWLPLLRALRDTANYDVTVCSAAGENRSHVFQQEGFHFLPLRMSRSSRNPVSEILTILSLARLYRRIQPEVVHHVTAKPVIYGTLVSRILRIKRVINSIPGLGFMFLQPGFSGALMRKSAGALYRWTMRRECVTTVFQNEDDLQTLGCPSTTATTCIIPGVGVDLARFHPAPEPSGDIVAMFAGRYLYDKGLREFAEASRIIQSRGVKCRMAILGKTDQGNPSSISESVLQGWVNQGLLEDWGFASDVPAAIAKSAIAVLPSYREGLPTFLIEAAAMSRPLVATDVPGCRDIVADGWNGYLVPAHNSEKLAEAILRLAEDRELRIRMGKTARRVVCERFSREVVIEKMLQVYERVTAPIRNEGAVTTKTGPSRR